MELDRERLALAVHKRYCLVKDCPKDAATVDDTDRDDADNINELLAHYEEA